MIVQSLDLFQSIQKSIDLMKLILIVSILSVVLCITPEKNEIITSLLSINHNISEVIPKSSLRSSSSIYGMILLFY